MKKIKYSHKDKNIVKYFKLHILEGWSTSSFTGRLTSGYKGIRYLKENNKEFKELYESCLHNDFKKRTSNVLYIKDRRVNRYAKKRDTENGKAWIKG